MDHNITYMVIAVGTVVNNLLLFLHLRSSGRKADTAARKQADTEEKSFRRYSGYQNWG